MKLSQTAVVAAVAVVVLVVALKLRADKPAASPPAVAEEAAPARPAPEPAAPVVNQPPPAAPAPPPVTARKPAGPPAMSEARLMDRLHELGSSDPEQSLALAREGNRRFKDSRDAPERASIIVKSLSSLGRHDEARTEALKMERDYPSSGFTQDVHRHMFVNPPTHPAERGYGKKYELE